MIRNILVIRFRRVGDSVLSMALCHSLKLTFPEAKIHFVINKNIASLYRNHPDIDRVITFDEEQQEGLEYVSRVRNIMHATHYDVIIDMRSTPKTLLFSLCSLSTPYRIGRYKSYNVGIHNYRIPTPPGVDRVGSNLRLMDPLVNEANLIKSRHFPLYITDQERADFRHYMTEHGIDFSKPVVTVAICTRIIGKAWDKLRMSEVLNRLIKQYDAQLIANFGGVAEKQVALDFQHALGGNPHFHTDIEAANLRQLCALLVNSDFFFGNEGGPRHIAQAFKVPSFAIYPPGIDMHFWLPADGDRYQGISPDEFINKDKQKVLTYHQRFSVITTERVWQRLSKMIDQYVMPLKGPSATSDPTTPDADAAPTTPDAPDAAQPADPQA